MQEEAQELRDRIVRMLARVSLIGILALMGALFVGSAAIGGTDSGSVAAGQRAEQEGVLDDARPVGLMLGAGAIGAGLVVLMVGAFRPPSRDGREFAELLRR